MPLYKRSLRNEFPGIVGDQPRIVKVVTAIMEGMQYAHEQGVVHRDLKPENILLNNDDDIVISDFGLGRAIDAKTTRATYTGEQLGTLGYMAPEQATHAKSADQCSDIFTLGRMIYELFSGESMMAVQDLTLLPVGIAMIVDKCTKTYPDNRFQTVEELRTAFASIVAARGKKSVDEKVRGLLGGAVTRGTLTPDDAGELAELVAQGQDDTDLLHDVCMELPTEAVGVLWRVNPVVTKLLIKLFTDQVAAQSWGFDYTDRIGAACVRLHRATSDHEVRGMLIAATVEVGVSHNRWHVMDLAAKLLSGRKEPGEGLAIAHALREHRHRLEALKDRVDLSKMDPAIRDLFREGV